MSEYTICREKYFELLSAGNYDYARVNFWRWVDVKGPDDCWNWTGVKSKFGYGRGTFYSGTKFYAHRMSWILHNGEVPDGLLVCHKCDNPTCVNPGHLFLGTAKDNTHDMYEKNRMPVKLSFAVAEEIRMIYKPRKFGYKRLAHLYNVCEKTIKQIIRYEIWATNYQQEAR